MERLQKLEAKVKDLYQQKDPGRDEWTDWLADNHVFVVADFATELAKKYDANEELARAAALLHGIATPRFGKVINNSDLSVAETVNEIEGLIKQWQ